MQWSIDVMRDFFPNATGSRRIREATARPLKTGEHLYWRASQLNLIFFYFSTFCQSFISHFAVDFQGCSSARHLKAGGQCYWNLRYLIWWKEQDLTFLSFSSWFPRRPFWKGRGRWLERPKRSSKKLGSLTKKVEYIFDTRIISLIASTKYTVQNKTWQVLIRWKWKYRKQNWRFNRFLRI